MLAMKKVNFLTISLALFLFACSKDGLPSGARGGGFNLADKNKHDQVINVLKERKIPYEVNSRGMTIYMLDNQAEVLGIIREVQYEGELDPNYFESEILQTEDLKEMYLEEFQQASIPYQLDSFDGKDHIFWSQTYGPKVDKIRQKINKEAHRLSRIKAVEEGRAPASLMDDLDK